MSIVTELVRNEDKAMFTARQAALDLGHRLHPSLIMGLLTVLVLLTLDIGILSPLRWSLQRVYELTGVLLSEQIWRVGLGVSAFLIAYNRPTPRRTLIYSFPLLTYIGMAAWYGMSADRLATPIVILIFFAFFGTLFVQLQGDWILNLLRENIALKERLLTLPDEANAPSE